MVTHAELFEAGMLICFSVSWYWSIAKMLRVRAAVGKSASFVAMICVGYLFGITAKLMIWWSGGALSPVLWLYCWNLVVTAFDLALVVYFSQGVKAKTA